MLARRLGLAIALLAGLIGSQGPEFAQQYRQRLGGPLEELNWIVSEFDAEVRGQNLTPAEALKRLEGNSDLLARERGEDMGKAIARADHLNEQLQAMNSAGPPMRLYVVATRFDSELARSARSTITNRPSPCRSALYGRRSRRALRMGDDAPHRLALQPPLPPSRGARVNRGGEAGLDLREFEHGRVDGEHRRSQSRDAKAVAVRVRDREAG
jgi:hypothetical protein